MNVSKELTQDAEEYNMGSTFEGGHAMKQAFRTTLVVLSAASLPVFAGGELGLLLDKQFGKAQTVAAGLQVHQGNYDSVNPQGYGIRGAVSVLDLKVLALGISATYRPKTEDDLVLGGNKLGKYGSEYYAVGAQLDWKFLVNLHAGVDLRREKFSSDAIGYTGSVTNTRPWVKAGLGFSVPLPVVSPFFRVEVAVPVSNEDNNGNPDELRKALAPRYQLAVYGGIRF